MDAAALDQILIPVNPFGQAVLAVALIIIMFAVALGLKLEHFAFMRKSPRFFVGGLLFQLVGLPVATLALILLLSPPASIALGMIVVAACPGGNVSNMMTWAARGDVAYSVSLTAGSSVIAALWTPTAILFWSGIYAPTASLLDTIAFNRLGFVAQTTLMLVLPLTAGMAISHYRPALAKQIRKPAATSGGSLLAFCVIVGTAQNYSLLAPALSLIAVPIVLHNALAFALGTIAGVVLQAPNAKRRTLTFEIGIQNTGLALVLLIAQLQGLSGAVAIAALWGIWHFFSGGAMIALYRYLDRNEARI